MRSFGQHHDSQVLRTRYAPLRTYTRSYAFITHKLSTVNAPLRHTYEDVTYKLRTANAPLRTSRLRTLTQMLRKTNALRTCHYAHLRTDVRKKILRRSYASPTHGYARLRTLTRPFRFYRRQRMPHNRFNSTADTNCYNNKNKAFLFRLSFD